MSTPIHVHDSEFEAKVLQSPTPVVVDFWAPWCGPCHMIAPALEELAKDKAGELVVAKVNTDEDSEWAMKFGVQGIPTLLFVSEGQIVDRHVGASPAPTLKARVEAFLDSVKAAKPA